jgi:hypothetical protein
MFFRYSQLSEDVTHDRNLVCIVVKVTLMTDPIEGTHYVNFVTSDIWIMMNYSDIYDVIICSVIFVMQMAFISTIGNLNNSVHSILLPGDIFIPHCTICNPTYSSVNESEENAWKMASHSHFSISVFSVIKTVLMCYLIMESFRSCQVVHWISITNSTSSSVKAKPKAS